nr:ring-H2 finger protein atl16 [Ipomoea batatas]
MRSTYYTRNASPICVLLVGADDTTVPEERIPQMRCTTRTPPLIEPVVIIGILTTGLLLVSYYVFVIKCCLNWHQIDLLPWFSFSRRRRVDEPFAVFSPPVENRGLDEAAIRSIPVSPPTDSFSSPFKK